MLGNCGNTGLYKDMLSGIHYYREQALYGNTRLSNAPKIRPFLFDL